MSTTVETLAQEVAQELGETFSHVATREQYIDWVIEAYTEIVASGWFFTQNKVETITLVAGTREYTLPATVSEIKTLEDPTSYRVISPAPVSMLLERGKNLAETGTPSHWYIDSFDSSQRMVISLYKVPDSTYVASTPTLRAHCILRPTALSDTTAIPLPDDYVKVCRDGVRYRARVASGQMDFAQLAKQDFASGLQLLNARYNGQVRPVSEMPAHSKAHRVAQAPAAGDR